jgi:hypothetical protein
MKWPWSRDRDDEEQLEESMRRHPSWSANQQIEDQALVHRVRGTWHDSHHYEEKYGRQR